MNLQGELYKMTLSESFNQEAEQNGMDLEKSFRFAVNECVNNPEFMKMYRRLTKARLGLNSSPLEAMIDKASGYDQKEWNDLFSFIRDYVWLPWITKK